MADERRSQPDKNLDQYISLLRVWFCGIEGRAWSPAAISVDLKECLCGPGPHRAVSRVDSIKGAGGADPSRSGRHSKEDNSLTKIPLWWVDTPMSLWCSHQGGWTLRN